MNFIDELEWRGFLHNFTPNTKEHFASKRTAYIGFDPTSDSLHIGSLIPIFLLVHLQKKGHIPIALIGSATGMVGDPSGKKDERQLLSEENIANNAKGIKATLSRFLDFSNNKALIVDNATWMKKTSFIHFIRDVGKHLTINYMLAKDSVKSRIETGLSFTEFSYQLIQAYDFYHLFSNYNCTTQLGGSDQWGNITSGIELIKRKSAKQVFAATAKLIKKVDGSKFGKSESGNIWLDKTKTSVYEFYQFWLNTSDKEAESFIRLFTFLPKLEINQVIEEHYKAPHLRILQKKLANEITTFVHSEKELQIAIKASEVLFSKGTKAIEGLKEIDEDTFNQIFKGVGVSKIKKSELEKGIPISELLSTKTDLFKSKGEVIRMAQSNGIAINKNVAKADKVMDTSDIIHGKYLLVQKGKKNYFIIKVLD